MNEAPDPLRPRSQAILASYRAQRAMPTLARDRVEQQLTDSGGTSAAQVPTHAWRWAAVGGALAAAIVAALVLRGDRTRVQETAPAPSAAQFEAPPAGTEGVAQTTAASARPRRRPSATTSDEPVTPVASPPSNPLGAAPSAKPSPDAATKPGRRQAPKRPPAGERRTPNAAPSAPPSHTASPSPASTLGDENRLISAAWRHVTAKAFDKADAVIDEHAARFATGVLAPERRALRAIVNCLGGAPSKGVAETFATRHPRSPLLKKVREACITSGATAPATPASAAEKNSDAK